MKRLVRSKTTGRYLRLDGAWLSTMEGAAEFPSIKGAEQHCREQRLCDVELVIVRGHGVARIPVRTLVDLGL